MKREVYLLETAQGYVAYPGSRSYTEDPDSAIHFVDQDVACERAREFCRFSGVWCEPSLYRAPFPRINPITPTSHGTHINKDDPGS